ncbi:hypothetical protein [Flavobacterium sp. ACAM 123]|jgi:hypothetical protein|uniref:hypothetical protein n=1 Tax=Flavobacterium sp. ACAM 123 TaxID=1189620 RepID=UPI0003189271|nr:hypothetical protein [Flavobacterium sp. ACAM 123]
MKNKEVAILINKSETFPVKNNKIDATDYSLRMGNSTVRSAVIQEWLKKRNNRIASRLFKNT